jgi:hypothetical protein
MVPPAVTAPPSWIVSSIAGQAITLMTTNSYGLPAASTADIRVNARTPAAAADCANIPIHGCLP